MKNFTEFETTTTTDHLLKKYCTILDYPDSVGWRHRSQQSLQPPITTWTRIVFQMVRKTAIMSTLLIWYGVSLFVTFLNKLRKGAMQDTEKVAMIVDKTSQQQRGNDCLILSNPLFKTYAVNRIWRSSVITFALWWISPKQKHLVQQATPRFVINVALCNAFETKHIL